MQLGNIIRELDNDACASAVFAASGDIILMARVTVMAGRFDEDPAEYVSGAVRRFSNLAVSEDWLALMNAVERAEDPGVACLVQMIGWSLKQDDAAAPTAKPHAGCTCGGGSCA
jgi:hypothetical protein